MGKRKFLLKEIQVRVPVHVKYPRTQEIDDYAEREAQRLSSTPIKRFKFLGARSSLLNMDSRELIYQAFGTPKEG